MFGIIGKLKNIVIAVLAVALPILYAVGRIRGKEVEKNKILADEVNAAHKATDFYKAMAEHEEDGTIADRNGLVNRLRSDGL
jgi:hypothetical protein